MWWIAALRAARKKWWFIFCGGCSYYTMKCNGMVELRIKRRLPGWRSQNGEPLRKSGIITAPGGYYTMKRSGMVSLRIKRRLPGWRWPEWRAVAQKCYINRFALRASRLEKEGGAWGGSRISVWTTPCLRV